MPQQVPGESGGKKEKAAIDFSREEGEDALPLSLAQSGCQICEGDEELSCTTKAMLMMSFGALSASRTIALLWCSTVTPALV